MKKFTLISVIITLFSFSVIGQVNLTKDLVAWYPFNKSALDSSGNGNNGIVHSAVPTMDRFGKADRAYRFMDTAFIEIPSTAALNPAKQLTIALWIKVDSLTNRYTPILHKGGVYQPGFVNREYIIYLENNGSLFAESTGEKNRIYTSTIVPVTKTWFFFVMVIDRQSGHFKIYLNGAQKVDLPDNDTSILANNSPIKLASWDETNGSYAPFFTGCLDDIRFYSRVLNDQEILALYNETPTGIAEEPAGRLTIYPNPVSGILSLPALNGNTMITIYDQSGKMVLNERISDNKADVSFLPKGLYFIKLVDGKGEKKGKFIRE